SSLNPALRMNLAIRLECVAGALVQFSSLDYLYTALDFGLPYLRCTSRSLSIQDCAGGGDCQGSGADYTADSGASTTSGYSSSVPHRMQTASYAFVTRPHRGQRRRGSLRSERYTTAVTRPITGTIAEIKNHSQNELPL